MRVIIFDSLLPDVDLDQFMNEPHNIKLTGQVMSLTAILALALVPDTTASRPDDQDPVGADSQTTSAWSWLWAGGYVRMKSSTTGTDEVSAKSIIVNVPGYLTVALNSQMICADQLQPYS